MANFKRETNDQAAGALSVTKSKWVAMAIHGDWWDISATRLAPKQWFKDLLS